MPAPTRDPVRTWEEYAQAWAGLHGGYQPLTASPLVKGWLRLAYTLGRAAGRVGTPPNAVTALGLLLSLGVPLAVGLGPSGPLLAAGLVLLSAVADTVDGALALATARTSPLGGVYDSLADRVAEACWLVALWRLGTPGWLVAVCGGLCWLHEYLRARAAVAGMVDIGAVTVGERPTRVVMVVAGLVLSAAGGFVAPELRAGTGTAIAAIWALLSMLGFGQLVHTVREALR